MKISFRNFLILATAVLFLLLSSNTAQACSCSITRTVDVVADAKPYIGIFKVEGVDEDTIGGDSIPKRATLIVEKIFKGNLTPGERFVFSNEGMCLVRFGKGSVGKRYLLYLHGPVDRGVWAAGMCSRSGRLSSKRDDVLYLEKWTRVRGKTRLSGSVSQQIESDGEPREWHYKSLGGIKLRVRGSGADITLTTDENGAYEVYDLRPGKYDIFIPEIKGFTQDPWNNSGEPISIEVHSNKHTERNIFYNIDNSLSGKLIDEEGLPVSGTCLELVATSHALPDYSNESACTDVKGEFQFFEILSGTYVLVGNNENKITPRNPFPKFYYRDKEAVAEPARFVFAPGVHFKGLVMRAPAFSGVINVNGVVRFSDGKPVVKADVEFFSGVSKWTEVIDSLSYVSTAETDENGNFRIRIASGDNGILVGSFTAYKNEYKHCPQIRKIIDEGGFGWENIRTPAVRVNTSIEIRGVELKFPFPGCAAR
jgi:hypothetical protein